MKFADNTIRYPMATTDPSWNRIFRDPPKLACKKMYRKRMNDVKPSPSSPSSITEQSRQYSDDQIHYAKERLRALSDMEKATFIVIKKRISPEYQNKQQGHNYSTL